MYFDHEKLTVYQESIKFVAYVAALLPRLQSPFSSIRDQLLRSSQSIALNIAEGNGKRSPALFLALVLALALDFTYLVRWMPSTCTLIARARISITSMCVKKHERSG